MKRGVSILEIIVCAACLGLLMAAVTPLLAKTVRALRRSDTDAVSQQNALVAVQKFFSEAAYSNGGSLCINTEDDTLCCFLSARAAVVPGLPTLDDPSDPIYLRLGSYSPELPWRKFVLVFHEVATKTLKFKEFRYENAELARVKRDRLQGLVYSPDAPVHTLASGISRFRVETPRHSQVWVWVKAEEQDSRTMKSEQRLIVTMRN